MSRQMVQMSRQMVQNEQADGPNDEPPWNLRHQDAGRFCTEQADFVLSWHSALLGRFDFKIPCVPFKISQLLICSLFKAFSKGTLSGKSLFKTILQASLQGFS